MDETEASAPAEVQGAEATVAASDGLQSSGVDGGASEGRDASLESLLRALAAPPHPTPAGSPRVGMRLGRFELTGELGRGGFGQVFEAVDTELGRRVALKVLRPKPDSSARLAEAVGALFRREAETVARLSHPGIVTLFDFGSWEGLPFLVLERLEGETLAMRLGRGPLGEVEALRLAVSVCEPLAYAHSRGFIHRDLKPSNVWLLPDGGVKLLDLGLARVIGAFEEVDVEGATSLALSPGTTSLFAGAGTPAYMAPEQWARGEQDARVDVFAVGVVLYECLTGTLPFSRSDRSPAAQPPVDERRLQGLPPRLAPIIGQALQVSPSARPPSAAALLEALRALLAPPPAAPAPRSRRGLLLGALGLAVSVAVGVALLTREGGAPARTEPAPGEAAPRLPVATPEHRQVTFEGEVAALSLSPDGEWLAYATTKGLYVQSARGEGRKEVRRGPHHVQLRWSPRGHELLFRAATAPVRTFFARAPDFRPEPAPDGAGAPAWSPDGTVLAHATGVGRKLQLVRRDGSTAAELPWPAGTLGVRDLDWSVSSGRLLSVTDAAATQALWVVSPDGGDGDTLLGNLRGLLAARWAPGDRAVYYLQERRGVVDLWRLPLVGGRVSGAPRVLLSGLPLGGSFSVTSDGRRLAYTREPAFSSVHALVVPPRQSGEASTRRISRGTAYAFSPSISPDGRQVAYAVGERPDTHLEVSTFEGAEPRTLPSVRGYLACPVWSPDGGRLAFTLATDDEVHLYVRGVGEGAAARRLPLPREHAPAREGCTLEWAPARELCWLTEGRNGAICAEPAGTHPPRVVIAPQLSRWLLDLRIAPDGRFLLSVNDRNRQGMWLADPQGVLERRLVPGFYSAVGWAADGRHVLVGTMLENARMSVGTVERRRILDGAVVGRWRLPVGGGFSELRLSSDGARGVGVMQEVRSDVWVVEHFDPEVERPAGGGGAPAAAASPRR